MSEENNKLIFHRLVEDVWNNGDMAVADEIVSTDYVDHASTGDVYGVENYKKWVIMSRIAFPDLKIRVEDLVAEGDKLAVRWSLTGTHNGEFIGIPPTGKQVMGTGMTIYRFDGNKVVERWNINDDLGFLQQLGVIPPLEKPKK